MKKSLKRYFKDILIGIDQTANAICFGAPDETLSSRCYRHSGKYWYARVLKEVLDFVFSPFGRDHCYQSYLSEIQRNHFPNSMK